MSINRTCAISSATCLRISVGVRAKHQNNALDSSHCSRLSRTKLAVAKSSPTANSALPISIQSVYFFEIIVPVVQRTEQGFPKGKTVFLLEFADVSSCEHLTIFKVLNNCYHHPRQSRICPFLTIRVTQKSARFSLASASRSPIDHAKQFAA